jgi:hypothetical protein
VYPRQQAWKRVAAVALVAVAPLAAGCGGEGSGSTTAAGVQEVSGAGFAFDAPGEWQVTRASRSATVKPRGGSALVSTTLLTLRSPYRPALFAKAVRELDRVTHALATKLNGKVIARRAVLVAGTKSRQYDVAYSRNGAGLVDRITYVLRGTTEYYLLCRWAAEDGQPQACNLLMSSFRVR